MNSSHTQHATRNISDLTHRYLRLPQSPKHATRNTWALLYVLQRGISGFNPDTVSTSRINADATRLYFAAKSAEASTAPNQRRALQIKRSANSIFRQAASIFNRRCLVDLHAPNAAAFLDAAKIHAFPKTGDAGFLPPPDPVIRSVLRDWYSLAFTPSPPSGERVGVRGQNRDLFLAIGLVLSCGLRRSELPQVRWSWWTTRDGGPVLRADGDVSVKNQSGRLEVVPLDPFWSILNRAIKLHGWHNSGTLAPIGGEGRGEGAIPACLPSPPSGERVGVRGQSPFTISEKTLLEVLPRQVSAFLRARGWNTEKALHSLRDYSASLITMRYGLVHAKAWCRHSTVATTEKHYNRFFDPVRALRPSRKLLRLRFAVTA